MLLPSFNRSSYKSLAVNRVFFSVAQTYIYIYIYIYMCVCVCVRACVRACVRILYRLCKSSFDFAIFNAKLQHIHGLNLFS